MVPVVTQKQMSALDRFAIDQLGIAEPVLMEVAGRAVADAVRELLPTSPGVVVAFAGTGNNGGDAVVAARILAGQGIDARIVLVGGPKRSPGLEAQLAIAKKIGVSIAAIAGAAEVDAVLQGAGVAIDGLFGIGLSRPIEAPFAGIIGALCQSSVPIVAVDIPSGIDADTGQILGEAIAAAVTVTFQFPKPGHLLYPGRAHAGELQVADIGIPIQQLAAIGAKIALLDDRVIDAALLPRPADAHKGTFGHLLVVAGVPDRPGAALLVGRAAMRAGTALVTIAAEASTVARIAGSLDELMATSLESLTSASILSALEHKTAVVIGPSLPPTPATALAIRGVIEKCTAPIVLDAGGLSAFTGAAEALAARIGALVITPHPGEAARLLGIDTAAVQRDRLKAAATLAERCGAIVVLKGAGTVIAAPDGRARICAAGNPGMATGGTGDVLGGIIGGLMAQGVEPLLAAEAGVQIHALAGDLAAGTLGEAGMIASDLIGRIPEVLKIAQERTELR